VLLRVDRRVREAHRKAIQIEPHRRRGGGLGVAGVDRCRRCRCRLNSFDSLLLD
jgi:hypothetical protein